MNKCVIIGGGTFNKVACHLALATPAFGSTAKRLKEIIDSWGLEDDIETQLVLTKMADSRSSLVTNEDVGKYLATPIKTTGMPSLARKKCLHRAQNVV